jgi:hypothetical protein
VRLTSSCAMGRLGAKRPISKPPNTGRSTTNPFDPGDLFGPLGGRVGRHSRGRGDA